MRIEFIRVNNDIKFMAITIWTLLQVPALKGPTMVREMPQVQQYIRINWHGNFHIKKGNENIQEQRVGLC